MRKSLAIYKGNLLNKTSGTSILIGIIVIGIIIWFMKGRTTQYQNTERWEIKRNEQGFAIEVIVHRDAKQS